jgi:methionyl-tRNA formyltransferase
LSDPGPLLVLTMPGFGIEALRHLVAHPAWPEQAVEVGLVGPRPPAWRRIAACARRALQRPADRLHPLADGTLAAGAAERFLRDRHIAWRWLPDDDAVRQWRAMRRPALTLTLTSRVLFSARTLDDTPGDWLNVHPGLLPEYAGASPGPYMFLDGVGGCTIHRMAVRVDAGALIDRAPMPLPLGEDGGIYFFQRLPVHTAARVGALLQRWRAGERWTESPAPDPAALRHCSSKRLARERRLDWRWPAQRLVRWVAALAAMAPACIDDGGGRRVEVMAAAMRGPGGAPVAPLPGTVLSVQGRWVEVACNGGVVALRCRVLPGLEAGQVLPVGAEAV